MSILLSKAALSYNVKLLAGEGEMYFWTFTLPTRLHPVVGAAMWGELCRELKRSLGFRGVRVFELHPGGHGLHVHVVTPDFIDVRAVLPICERLGWGRVGVEEWDKSDEEKAIRYMTKYLTKQIKSWCGSSLKGVRWWGVFGKVSDSVRVKDCSVESPRRRIWDSVPPWFVSHVMGIQSAFSDHEKIPKTAHEKRKVAALKQAFSDYFISGKKVKDFGLCGIDKTVRQFNFAKMWICNRIYYNYETFLDCFNGGDCGGMVGLRSGSMGFDANYCRAVAMQNPFGECPL